MKYIYLSLIAIVFVINSSYAQWTTGTNIYNTNTGNVGIGISNPLQLLQVNGNVSALAATGSANTYFMFQRSGDAYIGARIGNFYESTGYNGSLVFETNNGGGVGTLTEAMRINSLGNVGIGLTNPNQKLDISGNIRIQTSNHFYFDSSNGSSIAQDGNGSFNITASTASGGNGNITLNAASGAGIYLNFGSGSNTFFGNGASGTTGVIKSNGNVLIGQTTQSNAAYKLDVWGSVRANQVVVNTTGADFVFNPSYKLPTLSYLKNYINQNHHLPEIASAKEMQTDGWNLGENQTKLLQKVEELTLYLIEKDKQVAALQKANQQQIQNIQSLKEQMTLLKQELEIIAKKLK